MTEQRATYDVGTIYDDRGMVAGYVFQRRGRSTWGAILEGYCSCCAPEKKRGSFPDLAAAAVAVVAGLKAKPRQ
jgi:hypothetical protein